MHKEPVLSTPQCYAEYRSATSHLIISATRHAAARSLGRQSPSSHALSVSSGTNVLLAISFSVIPYLLLFSLIIFFCFLSSSNSYRSLLFICAVQAAPTTAPPQIPRLPTFCFPLYLKACPYVRTTEFLRQYLLSFYKFRQNNHNILII